ncbi:hypothetical protein TWF730_006447 [Orbilia blumenaviensis]|uniref:MYND-type domain-containing protein n=1 Tax=Orbilia blumenaviensis TaxID=1796055 RepID=A0AAV9VE96_9PEZI
MRTFTNTVQTSEIEVADLTWAIKADGSYVKHGPLYTTDNRSPGVIFLVKKPEFIPGQALKTDNSSPHYEVVRLNVVKEAIDLSEVFYQCSNPKCGKRIAAQLTRGCGRCGGVSTTRYCSEDCHWGDIDHWLICGKQPVLRGNVVPNTDSPITIVAKQTYVAPNQDAWRQQLAHAVTPGTYSLFMTVDEGGVGGPYRRSHVIGFPAGWEANAFGFLTRMAVDCGHLGAVRLLFRWLKRQLKRTAPVGWGGASFRSYVEAVFRQLCAEFGPWWAKGEDFFALDPMSSGGRLDLETVELMEREGWRLLEQDVPGFVDIIEAIELYGIRLGVSIANTRKSVESVGFRLCDQNQAGIPKRDIAGFNSMMPTIDRTMTGLVIDLGSYTHDNGH